MKTGQRLGNITSEVRYSFYKSFAFTLAEVLITLGIIGVVAAMTIPTLISNTNSRRFRSQYRKTLSTLNQAVRMAQSEYNIDFSLISGPTAPPRPGSSSSNTYTNTLPSYVNTAAILNTTLQGAIITTTSPYSTEPTHSQVTSAMYAELADGSIFIFDAASYNCSKDDSTDNVIGMGCVGYIDVNGKNPPNKLTNGADYGDTEVQAFNMFDSPVYAAPTQSPPSPSSGPSKTYTIPTETITVKSSDIKDIFPVIMYDSTVVPVTKSARYVLTSDR